MKTTALDPTVRATRVGDALSARPSESSTASAGIPTSSATRTIQSSGSRSIEAAVAATTTTPATARCASGQVRRASSAAAVVAAATMSAAATAPAASVRCTAPHVPSAAWLVTAAARPAKSPGTTACPSRAAVSVRARSPSTTVARGDKDVTTARNLDTSVRTVEREVQTVLTHLGVSSRQQAAMAILG